LLILTNGVLLRAGILFFSLQVKARSGAEMDRRLQWWDMIALGVGGMMGAGIFISTGVAARDYAGPAVVVSYLVAGISALLSAFCYTEFAVEMPVAGGAFSYLQITFGAQVLAHLLSCSPSSLCCCFIAARPPRLVATAVVVLLVVLALLPLQ
jgi:amino acid transporter